MRRLIHIVTGIILICAPAALAGCTDASWAKVTAIGTPARVTCYSGGEVILDDFSTGKVSSESTSDGIYFNSRTTGRLVEVSADCVVDHMTVVPAGWAPVLP
ncbi:hypothetical protein [Sphingomonas sp. ACRSK]|uniref:hypothetical protein n=1 Tax=Sphingomonas sp. ACRSK TaxID=2918213 RepID=UPI001EF734FD|nr:hypothetical protein [Sphingomonas sp. ACRSK]MCG7348818.1 hypothetical protein [Sphingomonas sp. ACRSK]